MNKNKMEKSKIDGGRVYREKMEQVSTVVNRFIQNKLRSLGLSNELEGLVLHLPLKRETKQIMRPTLSYLLYKTFGGQDSITNISPALAISELNNYYCYLDNWILDNKNDIGQDIGKIRDVTIASQILRETTQAVLEESPLSDDKKRRISKRLAETTTSCYEGQFQDLQMNLEALSRYPSEKEYLDAYLRKSELQSGHLYGLSGEIGAILANAREEDITLAENLCRTLGTGLHVSGDLGDFGIFREQDGSFKPYQDQFADIINGRLTFPTYYVLTRGTEREKKTLQTIVGRKDATPEEKLEVSKLIVNSGAYSQTRKILNDYYHQFKRLVHQLPECSERDALSSTGEIIRYNKYLRELQKLKGGPLK